MKSLINLQSLELLYLLVLKELKVRYKRSFLGYVWAIANPLLFGLVYWIAFKFIMRVQMENYILFIVTGMFPWQWLSQSVTQGTGSFVNNLSLVRRVKLPKLILPLANVFQELVHFMFAMPVVFLFMLASGERFSLALLVFQIPLMLVLQSCFVVPITVIGAVLNVYIRDIQYLVGILFAVLFYVTPMVYPLNMVPNDYQDYFKLNPVFWLIDGWRLVFTGNALPIEHLLWISGSIIFFTVFAVVIYRKLAPRLAELV